jgi:2-polyprenyl-3-methyl-5-hydroxy-6-metoxy-1,4-benzoquinol methylase
MDKPDRRKLRIPLNNSPPRCRACGNIEGNFSHFFREMMIGLRNTFEYCECSYCGSLSIVSVPADLSAFYPKDYYSFIYPRTSRLLGYLRKERDHYYLQDKGLIGKITARFSPPPAYIEWIRILEIDKLASILDVGCGGGGLTVNLQDFGFRATGLDPFVEESMTFSNGARILKQQLYENQDQFDVVMLNHSIEHMESPPEVFRHLKRLCKPKGQVLIRMPVAGKEAWRVYGADWFQIDAPRHLIILSEKAILNLVKAAGFKVKKIVYDSNGSQFWASEQFRRDIPTRDIRSFAINPDKSIFSDEQIQGFSDQAKSLNEKMDGDQACFFLERLS